MTAFASPLLRPAFLIAFALSTATLMSGCTSDEPTAPHLALASSSDGEAAPILGKRGNAFADVIPLPDGFQPEGIATGRGSTFYVGSLADGSIYRGDLRTGEGEILITPSEERIAVGLAYDQRNHRLFVAGQSSGEAYVYDAETGDEVATFELTAGGDQTFINDVVVTRTGAYFTNSFQPEIYRLPLTPRGDVGDAETLPLTGDYESVDGFNANGIEATPNGEHLIIVNSTTGTLYRVDPETGEASEIDLGGDSVTAGDGILLDGRTLYVVRNQFNEIAVVELSPDFAAGEITGTITSDDFDVPTTVAEHGNDLYAVNARFGISDPGDAEYNVVRVSKR